MKTPPISIQTLALILLALALGSQVRAQDSDSGQASPPSPPYVRALSGDFALVRKFSYPSGNSLTPEQKAEQGVPTNLMEVDAVKKGAVRKDTEHFLDGSGRTIWRVDAYRFIVYLAHPDEVTLNYAGGPNDSPLLGRYRDAADFPELDWITAGTFQGVQMWQDKKCFAYKSGDDAAWIDFSTHLPLYYSSKTVQITYTWSNPPDEPLNLPAGYLEKLNKYKRAMRGQD